MLPVGTTECKSKQDLRADARIPSSEDAWAVLGISDVSIFTRTSSY